MKLTAGLLLLSVLLCASCGGAKKKEDPRWRDPAAQAQEAELGKAKKGYFKQLKSEVGKGYKESRVLLGELYYTGTGTTQDYKKAYALFQEAALDHDAQAQIYQAKMLLFGKGVEPDFARAFDLIAGLAENRADAAYLLSSIYLEGLGQKINTPKGLELLEKSAKNGFSPAQYDLATQYATGLKVKQDIQKAFKLYQAAADQHLLLAQYEVAQMYQQGRGTELNAQKAFYYMHQAALKNYPQAQRQLGAFYQDGFGTEPNTFQAFYWTGKAAKRNDPQAQLALSRYYQNGIGARANDQQARYWQERAKQNAPLSYDGTEFGY